MAKGKNPLDKLTLKDLLSEVSRRFGDIAERGGTATIPIVAVRAMRRIHEVMKMAEDLEPKAG